MKRLLAFALLLSSRLLGAQSCPSCAEWNATHKPFQIFGNTYFVGTNGLSSILITSPTGHVLIDGALAESAPVIMEHIRELGFRVEDVKLILNSHAHYDHAAGIAAIQRASGASVAASPWSARVIEKGSNPSDDPQFGILPDFTPVKNVRVIADGEVMKVGTLALTAHFTPGHTPGGTSWTWRSCDANRCLDFVYADSQTPVSADNFSFTKQGVVKQFERGFATLNSLPCDVLVTPHPGASRFFERVESNQLVDANACRDYVKAARAALAKRIATESGAR
jgi:metallo-beta-lactamase class B